MVSASQRPLTDNNTQHSQQTDIHAPGWIRTHNLSSRAATETGRFYVILQSFSSRFELNIEELNQYTKDTAKLFVKEYPWFGMPSSVHKILVLGADIVSGAILSLVQLSEEAQEFINKDRKYSRREKNLGHE